MNYISKSQNNNLTLLNNLIDSTLEIINHTKRLYEVYIVDQLFYGRIEKQFYQVLGGHILFQTLFAAVEFDLFNFLNKSGPRSLEDIARKLEVNEQACRIMLLGLVTTNFLKIRNGKYHNTLIAKRYLLDDSPCKYSACIKWQHYINYKPLYKFYESIKANTNLGLQEITGSGDTLYERLTENPKLELLFQEAMQEISKQSNHLLPKYLDLTNTSYLVDVGGGNGTNIIELSKKYPDLKASVFDSETVGKIAENNISKNNLSDRLSAIKGNIFNDPLPEKVDCFLFCHFFTIWSKEQNLELLKKAYNSLDAGGKTVIFNMMQNTKQNGPLTAAIGSPYFLTLATGTGMLYTWKEYEELFLIAGFKSVKSIKLPRDHGIIIGIK